MNISDDIWSTPTMSGQTLGERVSRKAPAVRIMDGDSFQNFVNVWNERLRDSVDASNHEMEKKARLVLGFLEQNKPPGILLLLWGEFKLSAIYNSNLERIFLVE
jgi:hypothetical protein